MGGNYISYINSTKNARGVGIFIKKNIDYKVLDTYKSECENIILLKIEISGAIITIGSIYGPRTTDDKDFFLKLYEKTSNMSKNFYLTGDLNTITDCTIPSLNIELENMLNIPNLNHCRNLIKLANEEKIIDAFRLIHPQEKAFSYQPFIGENGPIRHNKSRLDHVITDLTTCTIIDDIQYHFCPTFDHKSMTSIFTKNKKMSNITIDNNLLHVNAVNEIGIATLIDSVNDYAIFKMDKDNLINVRQTLSDLKSLSIHRVSSKPCRLIDNIYYSKVELFESIIRTFPSTNSIINNGINIDPIALLRTMLNNATIEISSFQLAFKKAENLFIEDLYKELNNTDLDEEKQAIEKLIREKEERKLLIMCSKFKKWKTLNLEKPTARYCLIMQKAKNKATLDQVLNYDNIINNVPQKFESKEEWAKYIINFYKEIYEQPSPKRMDLKQFLGKELHDSERLKSFMLNDEEINHMKGDITLDELEKAAKRVKTTGAGGPDGLSYGFFKMFFDYIGLPILNCFNTMMQAGKLLEPFNRVKILLIPKKKDASSIKNFRPISLCFCSYKIFSTAITDRLRKVIEKNISQDQKGYSKLRVIQECVISIFNRISLSNKGGVNHKDPSAVLAIDFKKAFDRLGHSYIFEILQYLKYPPCFINIIKSILTNRIGYISNLNRDDLTIQIKSGIPQGDAISAYLFIIGLMPLLWKLDSKKHIFNPEKSPVLCTIGPKMPDNAMELDIHENDIEITTKSCYADDLTIIFNATHETCALLFNIMREFHALSGLECNFEKTSIMFLGQPNDELIDLINQERIEIVDSINVLGFEFDARLEHINLNIDKSIEKIATHVNFLKNLYLSLPGRVAMCKTYLISQLSYMFSVIIPTPDQISQIDKLVRNFVCSGMKISSESLSKPPNLGGLGVTDAKTISILMRMNLFARHIENPDGWAKVIKNSCLNDRHLLYDKYNPELQMYSTSRSILESFTEFQQIFYSCKKRIMSIPLRFSSFFQNLSPSDLSCNFITCITNILGNNRSQCNLKFSALFNHYAGITKNKEGIEAVLGTQISNAEYLTIKNFGNHIVRKFKIEFDSPVLDMLTLVMNIKSGSKRFKQFFYDDDLKELKGIKTRLKHIGMNINDFFGEDICKREKSLINLQKCNALSNRFREFTFKFRSGLLYSNASISKFADVDPICNQCNQSITFRPANREITSHLLIDCPVKSNILNEIILRNPELEFLHDSTNLLIGSLSENTRKRELQNLIVLCFQYAWYCLRNIGTRVTAEMILDHCIDSIETGMEKECQSDAKPLLLYAIQNNNQIQAQIF